MLEKAHSPNLISMSFLNEYVKVLFNISNTDCDVGTLSHKRFILFSFWTTQMDISNDEVLAYSNWIFWCFISKSSSSMLLCWQAFVSCSILFSIRFRSLSSLRIVSALISAKSSCWFEIWNSFAEYLNHKKSPFSFKFYSFTLIFQDWSYLFLIVTDYSLQ